MATGSQEKPQLHFSPPPSECSNLCREMRSQHGREAPTISSAWPEVTHEQLKTGTRQQVCWPQFCVLWYWDSELSNLPPLGLALIWKWFKWQEKENFKSIKKNSKGKQGVYLNNWVVKFKSREDYRVQNCLAWQENGRNISPATLHPIFIWLIPPHPLDFRLVVTSSRKPPPALKMT